MTPMEKLIKDLEKIKKEHDGDEPAGGCYGMGPEHLCPSCAALERFKKATSKQKRAAGPHD